MTLTDSPSHLPPVARNESAAPPRDARPWLLLLSLLVIGSDLASKRWIVDHIPSGQARTLIPGILRLTHVLNTGAAFSAFADTASPDKVRYALVAFSVVAVLIVGSLIWRAGRALTVTGVALALILGGALGNLLDRIRLHYVVDFIEVRIVHYHWPDFNLADSCICIGAGLLILEIFRPQADRSAT